MEVKIILFIKRHFFKFKYFVRFKVQDRHWQFFAKFVQPFRTHKYREVQKSFGALNPDLIFFVIRRRPPAWGFFSNVNYVLQGILYAEKNGYVPIVDMENYWVAELSSRNKINGTYNAWCYLFNQISIYSLDEVYKSKNVILSKGSNILDFDHWFSNRQIYFMTEPDKLRIISELLKKYIRFNASTLNNISKIKKEVAWEGKRTLGIFIRGTGFISYQGAQMPVASLDFIILSVRKMIQEGSIDRLFISTEDYRIYSALRESFTEETIIPSIRHPKNMTIEKWITSQKQTYDHGILMGYEATLKYLLEIILLSECSSFIGTLSNASAFALALNDNKYEDSRVIVKNEVINLRK